MIQRISKRNQGNRGKGPTKSPSDDEDISLFENILVLTVGYFLRIKVLVPPKNSQKLHKLPFHTLLIRFDHLHDVSILKHLQIFAIPAIQKILIGNAEEGMINRFFTFDQFGSKKEKEQFHGGVISSFEVVNIFFYNLEEFDVIFDCVDCDEEVIGNGHDGFSLLNWLAGADPDNSLSALSEVGRIPDSGVHDNSVIFEPKFVSFVEIAIL